MEKTFIIFLFLQCLLLSPCNGVDIKVTSNTSNNCLHEVTQKDSNVQKNPLFLQNKTKLREERLTFVNEVSYPRNSFPIYTITNVRNVWKKIRSEGINKLKILAQKIKKRLKGKLYTYPVTNDISKNYIAEIDAYFDYILKQKTTCQIEEKFYILDLVETFTKIFGSQCRQLLKQLSSQLNDNILKALSPKLIQKTEHYIVKEKIHNFDYVCENLQICGSFPAFSDYAASLLNDILKLPDEKILTLVRILKAILTSKADFLKHIAGENVIRVISNKLESISEKIPDMRKFLVIVKNIFKNKFNLYKSKDGEIKKRSIAVRILIDMVDRTYELLGHHYTKSLHKNIEQSITSWTNLNDIWLNLKNYIDSFEDVVKFYWPSNVIQEVKVLTQLLIIKNAYIDTNYHYLFRKGSSIDEALFQNYKVAMNVLY